MTIFPGLLRELAHAQRELPLDAAEQARAVGLEQAERRHLDELGVVVAIALPSAVSTFHPAGARNVNPVPWTRAGGWSGSLDPPQPARMRQAANVNCLGRRAPGIRRAVTRRKDSTSMAKTRDKVYDAAGNVKPYVERAMADDKLRDDVMSAFSTARELYNELLGGRGAVTLATRVATDEDMRDKLGTRSTISGARRTGSRARRSTTPATRRS